MSIKSIAAKALARHTRSRLDKYSSDAVECQLQTLKHLIRKARHTVFGKEHFFDQITGPDSFAHAVPTRDYEELKPWIERVKTGEKDILWPGKPVYFCKTSGTTSGTKYIPLTHDSIPNHINGARNALLSYIAETGNASFVDGKMIFLQGSPSLDTLPSGIPFGRLSGIVANHVPSYLQQNRMPSYHTNCIEDWESKVKAIIDETISQDMRLISGIPSWVQMYFEQLLETSGCSDISSLFPRFSLFVFGGVNFDPYRNRFRELIGKEIDSIETYPASEGFIAFQDSQKEEGLLLNIHSGIFFEFIPVADLERPNPRRLHLGEVTLGENYALILSNNAGLWSYSIGDTVRFVSLSPPRIKVTGRIKHFTSAFGEHVIAEEVEKAMALAVKHFALRLNEFHVAPVVNPAEGLPYHEWLIEFEEAPMNLNEIALYIDKQMTVQNIYYADLIRGGVLRPLAITTLKKGSFHACMKAQGKLGGQNKVQRLSNDYATALKLKQSSTEI